MEPCRICGAAEYTASYGGPGICPKCDCGVFDANVMAWNNNKLSTELAALKEVLDDKRRLTREIDVILNGENAAKQASLCDLIGQIKELATLQGLVREMGAVLDKVANHKCCEIVTVANGETKVSRYARIATQILNRPEVKAVLEGGK
ncbi:MAG: hypothetical protein WC503_00930 [Candidatus Shapirobacteria bacterium]